jgi:hypothetical protein
MGMEFQHIAKAEMEGIVAILFFAMDSIFKAGKFYEISAGGPIIFT